MLYINGTWETSEDNLEVTSPTTGQLLGTVAKGGEHETKLAIDAAKKLYLLGLNELQKKDMIF